MRSPVREASSSATAVPMAETNRGLRAGVAGSHVCTAGMLMIMRLWLENAAGPDAIRAVRP